MASKKLNQSYVKALQQHQFTGKPLVMDTNLTEQSGPKNVGYSVTNQERRPAIALIVGECNEDIPTDSWY